MKIEDILQEYIDQKEKSGNEYIYIDEENVPHHVYEHRIFPPYRIKPLKEITNEFGVKGWSISAYYYKKDINRLNPDKINNVEFWQYLTKHFPLSSVCGAKNVKTMQELLDTNVILPVSFGFFEYLFSMLRKKNLNVLEIGFGYGLMKFMIDRINAREVPEQYADINNQIAYFGIDIVNRFERIEEKPCYFITDGNSIPDEIPSNLDMVFSLNVFQHLSVKQRQNYLKLAYDKLRIGGKFIFSANVMTDDNVGDICWGVRDKSGRCYTHFFGQYTPCETTYEIEDFVTSIGYSIEHFQVLDMNKGYYILNKD